MRIPIIILLLWLSVLAALATHAAYRLGPEDVISVTVQRHPEFSGNFLIPPDGVVDLPAAGKTPANGRTLEELTGDVRARLGKRLRKPEVTIVLRTARPQHVYVLGAVAKPGVYDLQEGWRVTEALAAGGGLTAPEDSVRINVMREGKPVAEHASTMQTALRHGDTVKVELLRAMSLTVSGKVKQPGTYQIKDGDTLVTALTLAGGPLPEAALSRVTIQREGLVPETVNLAPALLEGNMAYDVPVKAGDLVIVPESTARIAVLGFVNQPGYYTLIDGKPITLSDAISMAKGSENKRGGMTAVAVLRTEGGKQQRSTYNLQKFLKGGDLAQNPLIKNGDIVFVPETKRMNWDLLLQALSSVGALIGPVL